MKMRKAHAGRLLGISVGIVLLLLVGAGAVWADYPSKNINVMVPTSEGGALDRVTRAFTNVWRDHLGVNFQSTFHPGASGEVGYRL